MQRDTRMSIIYAHFIQILICFAFVFTFFNLFFNYLFWGFFEDFWDADCLFFNLNPSLLNFPVILIQSPTKMRLNHQKPQTTLQLFTSFYFSFNNFFAAQNFCSTFSLQLLEIIFRHAIDV
jgi:hypothetical protein